MKKTIDRLLERFGLKSAPVTVNINEITRRFELHHNRYEASSDTHHAVLAALGRITGVHSYTEGSGKRYLTDPDKKVASPMGDGDRPISAQIAYTLEDKGIFYGRNAAGFGLVIRREAADYNDYLDSTVFGLYGLLDKDSGELQVHKLVMPVKDNANRMSKPQDVPVTAETTALALMFAEKCFRAIVNGEIFSPRLCYDEAISGTKPYTPKL